jgi:hypothetical protein
MRRTMTALFDDGLPEPETVATLEGTHHFVDENGIDIEMLTHIVDVLVYARWIISVHAKDDAILARNVCAIALRFAHRIVAWSTESFADIANRCFDIGLPDRIAWRFAQLILGHDELRRSESETEAISPDNSSVRAWFDMVDAALTDTLGRSYQLIAIGKAFGFVADAIEKNYRPDLFEIALLEEGADSCSFLDTIHTIMSIG